MGSSQILFAEGRKASFVRVAPWSSHVVSYAPTPSVHVNLTISPHIILLLACPLGTKKLFAVKHFGEIERHKIISFRASEIPKYCSHFKLLSADLLPWGNERIRIEISRRILD
jgi:hypothetical protein